MPASHRHDQGVEHVDVSRLALGVTLLRQDHRHPEDDRDLGELRRLQRQPTRQQDPGVGPVDRLTERGQNDDQTEDRSTPEDRGVGTQQAVVEARDHHGEDDAHREVDQLLLEKGRRVQVIEGELASRRRPDEQRSDHRQRQRGTDEHPVHLSEVRRRAPSLRRRQRARVGSRHDAHRRRSGSRPPPRPVRRLTDVPAPVPPWLTIMTTAYLG